MNNRAFTISLLMALAATFMVWSYIDSKEQEWAKRYGDESTVVIAKKDISELDQINEMMLDEKVIPKQYQDAQSFQKKKDVLNMIALIPIRKGDQISANKVGPLGLRTGLSRQVAPGKRAISISVTETSSVSKLLKPGDRIDILVTVEPPNATGRGNQVTRTLLQDVPVLAVGKFVTSQIHRSVTKEEGGREIVKNLHENDAYATVTVEVDPSNAQVIAFLTGAPGMGFTISLRNNDDTERVALPPLHMGDILGGDLNRGAPAAPAIRAPASM